MFEVLLKAKIELENRVRDLEQKKNRLIRLEIEQYGGTTNSEDIQKILTEDLKSLEKIYEHYFTIIQTRKQLSDEIKEANKLVSDIDKELDEIIERFGLELPEELKIRKLAEDLENSTLGNTYTEDTSSNCSSDKENTLDNLKEPEPDNFDPDSFSPRIFISKTPGSLLDTPAFKSTRKIPIRRCLQD
jgi:hypothetical protein